VTTVWTLQFLAICSAAVEADARDGLPRVGIGAAEAIGYVNDQPQAAQRASTCHSMPERSRARQSVPEHARPGQSVQSTPVHARTHQSVTKRARACQSGADQSVPEHARANVPEQRARACQSEPECPRRARVRTRACWSARQSVPARETAPEHATPRAPRRHGNIAYVPGSEKKKR